MRRVLIPLVLLTIAYPVAPSSSQSQTPRPSDKVVIDGSRNPEMIPLWLIWSNTFSQVTHLASRPDGVPAPLHEWIGVSQKDLDIIVTEARDQTARERRRFKEYEPIVKKLKEEKKSIREMFDAVEPMELEDRWEYLAGRDRLIQRLSPEGLIGLQRWIDATVVKGLHMTIPKSDYERFRRPM